MKISSINEKADKIATVHIFFSENFCIFDQFEKL